MFRAKADTLLVISLLFITLISPPRDSQFFCFFSKEYQKSTSCSQRTRIIGAALADEGFYVDTNAVNDNSDNSLTTPIPTIEMEIITSNAYLAGTNDTVYATFIGDFSTSGPHSIGSFQTGSSVIRTVPLQRVIGNLQSVLMQKDGYDGWLIADLECRLKNVKYHLTRPSRQWLANLNSNTEALYGNGYEPNAQENLSDLPASSTLLLDVASSVNLFTAAGPYNGW